MLGFAGFRRNKGLKIAFNYLRIFNLWWDLQSYVITQIDLFGYGGNSFYLSQISLGKYETYVKFYRNFGYVNVTRIFYWPNHSLKTDFVALGSLKDS